MRKGLIAYLAGCVAFLMFAARHPQASAPQSAFPINSTGASQQALIDKYCVTCHNQRAKTGGLALDTHRRYPTCRPAPRSGKRSSAKFAAA